MGKFFLLTPALLVVFVLLSTPIRAEQAPPFVAPSREGVQQVELVGGDYYFTPNHIVVRVNLPVELTVKKAPGLVPHNIVMDQPAAGLSFTVDFGEQGETIRFTPRQAGIFPFYCDKKLLFFKGHRERGMEGVLEVVE